MSLSDASKERIKFRATFLNTLAAGFILVGALTPTIGIVTTIGSQATDDIKVGIAVICLVISGALHFGALAVLGGLDR